MHTATGVAFRGAGTVTIDANTPFPLGAYLGVPQDTSASNEAAFEADYSSFVQVMGAAPQFLDYYVDETKSISDWVSNAQWQADSAAASTDSRTAIPVVGIPMVSAADGLTADQYFRNFAAGDYDSVLYGIVQAWAKEGFSTLYFRPGWEMNLSGTANYVGDSAQNQADFVTAFQHIYTVLHAAAAEYGVNVQVVWNPGVTNYSNAEALTSLYPGNNYVDVIGADMYSDIYPYNDSSSPITYHDWATGGEDSTVEQFISNPVNEEHYWTYPAANKWGNDVSGGHALSLDQIISFAEKQGKPLALPETGAGGSNSGTDVEDDAAFPQWLAQQLTTAEQAGETIDFVNIWDSNATGENYEYSEASDDKPLEAAAWAELFGGGPTILTGQLTGVLGGTSIDLIDSGGTIVATTTTSVDGEYAFNDLSAGAYRLSYVNADNSNMVQGATVLTGTVTTLSGGAFESAADVQGTVPSAGTVTLLDASGMVAASATFDASGTFNFSELLPGSYDLDYLSDLLLPTIMGDTPAIADFAREAVSADTMPAGSADYSQEMQLAPGQTFDISLPDPNSDNGGAPVASVACYQRGTMIDTEHGPTAVEELCIGDRVRTFAGPLRRIRWIGHRSYDGRFVGTNRGLLPIVFRAGSLGEGIPTRDLAVSPKHAMFLDGVLIPAERLVNGWSVVQSEPVETLSYYHVELDSHDILLAEGAPSESFVDDNSRMLFQNADEFFQAYPHVIRSPARYYAPRLESGEVVELVRRRIAARLKPVATPVGALRGHLEVVSRNEIRGWARDGYLVGTKLSTQRGKVPVEELRAGDMLMTRVGAYRAVRRVSERHHSLPEAQSDPSIWPVCIRRGALSDGIPHLDLFLGAEQELYFSEKIIPSEYLTNDISIYKKPPSGPISYYKIFLDAIDGILAEGVVTQSCIDEHDRGSVGASLADAAPAEGSAQGTCHLNSGMELERIRRELGGRAWRLKVDGRATPGALTGRLDELRPTRISGWAYDPDSPNSPVLLSILSNGAEIGRVLANRHREDLSAAAIGGGCCAFELNISAGLNPKIAHSIEIWSADGQSLLETPAVLEPRVAAVCSPSGIRQPAEASLGALRGRLDGADRRRVWGWAQDDEDSERPVNLLILLDGNIMTSVLSNHFRADLKDAQTGSGRHGFDVHLKDELPQDRGFEVRVIRECDGSELQGSPLWVPGQRDFARGSENELLEFLQGYVGDGFFVKTRRARS